MDGRSAAVLALVVAMGYACLGMATQAPATVTITTVIEGDTVDVNDAGAVYRVRALGIDAPDVTGQAQCWGAEAAEYARRTLTGLRVQLVTDPTQHDVDQWGRKLRYILLPDGKSYSVLATAAGAAWSAVTETPPDPADAEIITAEQTAKTGRVGLWGPPCNGQHRVLTPGRPSGRPGGEPQAGGAGGAGAAPVGVLLIDAGGELGPWRKAQDDACVAAGARRGCLPVHYTGDDPDNPRSHDCSVTVQTPANVDRRDDKSYVPAGTTITVEAECEIDPAPNNGTPPAGGGGTAPAGGGGTPPAGGDGTPPGGGDGTPPAGGGGTPPAGGGGTPPAGGGGTPPAGGAPAAGS
jgi:micrococcal nuclease